MWNKIIVCTAVAALMITGECSRAATPGDVDAWRALAAQGDAEAQANLADCYYTGSGVILDKAKAVKWYRRAAEQGHALSQWSLGTCYYKGEGVVQDFGEAYKWLILAVASGCEQAGSLRDIVAKQMTVDQIAEAQAQAKEWQHEKEQASQAKPPKTIASDLRDLGVEEVKAPVASASPVGPLGNPAAPKGPQENTTGEGRPPVPSPSTYVPPSSLSDLRLQTGLQNKRDVGGIKFRPAAGPVGRIWVGCLALRRVDPAGYGPVGRVSPPVAGGADAADCRRALPASTPTPLSVSPATETAGTPARL